MYLMRLDVASLEHLRKATESKQVVLENPVIVKTKDKQYPLVLDKGEYSDYITPYPVKFSPEAVQEVYLIMEFRSTAVHDILIHTEEYDVVDFDLECLNDLIDSL